MDVVLADKLKIKMRLIRGVALRHIKKEYGVTLDDIVYDLENCGDPSIEKMWEIIKSNADKCIMKHQQNETKLWSAIGLWVMVKDTAYRDIFFSITKELLDAKDEIYDSVKKLTKEPEHWYANAHEKSIRRRRKGQADGDLLDGGRPYDETIAVPGLQKPRIRKDGQEVEAVKIFR